MCNLCSSSSSTQLQFIPLHVGCSKFDRFVFRVARGLCEPWRFTVVSVYVCFATALSYNGQQMGSAFVGILGEMKYWTLFRYCSMGMGYFWNEQNGVIRRVCSEQGRTSVRFFWLAITPNFMPIVLWTICRLKLKF